MSYSRTGSRAPFFLSFFLGLGFPDNPLETKKGCPFHPSAPSGSSIALASEDACQARSRHRQNKRLQPMSSAPGLYSGLGFRI